MSFKSSWCWQCVNMRIPLMGQFVRKCYIHVIFHLYDNQTFWHFSVLPKITLLFWDWNVTIDNNSTQCILKLHKIDFSNFSYGLFIYFIINLCSKTHFSAEWWSINCFMSNVLFLTPLDPLQLILPLNVVTEEAQGAEFAAPTVGCFWILHPLQESMFLCFTLNKGWVRK